MQYVMQTSRALSVFNRLIVNIVMSNISLQWTGGLVLVTEIYLNVNIG
jgi:hypothetical protein